MPSPPLTVVLHLIPSFLRARGLGYSGRHVRGLEVSLLFAKSRRDVWFSYPLDDDDPEGGRVLMMNTSRSQEGEPAASAGVPNTHPADRIGVDLIRCGRVGT